MQSAIGWYAMSTCSIDVGEGAEGITAVLPTHFEVGLGHYRFLLHLFNYSSVTNEPFILRYIILKVSLNKPRANTFIVHNVKNSMEQSSFISFCDSASQKIPHILWNHDVHYRVHKSPPLVPILEP
jgi:hypothetical protein